MAINEDKVLEILTSNDPEKMVDLNIVEPDRMDKKDKADSTAIKSAGAVDSGDISQVDDIQKKNRRAKRFGLSVKLTEKEKRNYRADRFGTVAEVNDSDGAKKADELKRKARADRFSVPASTSTIDNSEEEAKKKAMLARFGKDTEVDSTEDDKRKARALRFSNPASDSSSELPGKGNIGKEAALLENTA